MQKDLNPTPLRIKPVFWIAAGIFLLASAFFAMPREAAASPAPQNAGQVDPQPIDNSACLGCHNQPGKSVTLPNGEKLSITIDAGHYADSVHADTNCTDCHTYITELPHPRLQAVTRRDVTLQLYTSCQKCHAEQYDKILDSVHQSALAGGNNKAAVCTDCHNPHTQTRITDPESGDLLPEARLDIPKTCARCHSAIYDIYAESVHGEALTVEGNLDVPTCIDCHGVHNIQDPTTARFRNDTPQLCATCHTNAGLMAEYDISTDVLNTYVADFHGTTVTLFEQTSPDTPTNKPVCTDCHGVHSIKRVDDPVYGLAMKDNILKACQNCHPDASANFPDAWMSHYIPSPDKYPIVYYVRLFYKFFIPGVLIPMAVFVVSDIVRRIIERRKGAKHA